MDNYFHLWMHVWYSSFYSGESMAKSLISFEVDRQFRGLSRAVVRGNLVMWNFSSSLSLKYMWNHLWCTGEKIVYRLLIKGFLRETIKEKARGWTGIARLSTNIALCVTFTCCQTIIIMLCWLENHKLLTDFLPIFFSLFWKPNFKEMFRVSQGWQHSRVCVLVKLTSPRIYNSTFCFKDILKWCCPLQFTS